MHRKQNNLHKAVGIGIDLTKNYADRVFFYVVPRRWRPLAIHFHKDAQQCISTIHCSLSPTILKHRIYLYHQFYKGYCAHATDGYYQVIIKFVVAYKAQGSFWLLPFYVFEHQKVVAI